MKNTARSKKITTVEIKISKGKSKTINSRVFLPSQQCMGERNNYLFAFGGEF